MLFLNIFNKIIGLLALFCAIGLYILAPYSMQFLCMGFAMLALETCLEVDGSLNEVVSFLTPFSLLGISIIILGEWAFHIVLNNMYKDKNPLRTNIIVGELFYIIFSIPYWVMLFSKAITLTIPFTIVFLGFGIVMSLALYLDYSWKPSAEEQTKWLVGYFKTTWFHQEQ